MAIFKKIICSEGVFSLVFYDKKNIKLKY